MAGKVKLDRFWNIVQVADYLTVTETTVRRWVAAGQFPEPVLFGPRSRRWRESTVLAWVEARAKASQEAG